MNHMGGPMFSPTAFLVSIFNFIIVIGIIVFVPYMLLSINRRLGRIASLMEELLREQRNQPL